MTNSKDTSSKHWPGGQIGIAAVGVSLCAACGVAWLNGGDNSSTASSFAPAQTSTSSSAANDAPVPEEGDVFTAQSSPLAATATFAIIVKFRNEPEIADLGKTFRKDPEGTRAKFRAWAADKPALRGLTLERASYSGELVLTGSGSRDMKEVIASIEAMDNVAYVEPDYSAQPSKEG